MSEDLAKLHESSAAEYGADWLTANQTAVQLLQAAGLALEKHERLGISIARRLCQWKKAGAKGGRK